MSTASAYTRITSADCVDEATAATAATEVGILDAAAVAAELGGLWRLAGPPIRERGRADSLLSMGTILCPLVTLTLWWALTQVCGGFH